MTLPVRPARRRGQTFSELVALLLILLAMVPFILIIAGKARSLPRLSFLDAPRSVAAKTEVKFTVLAESVSKWFGVRPVRKQRIKFRIEPATSGRITGYWDRLGELVMVDQLSIETATDREGLVSVRVIPDDPGSFRLTASLLDKEAEEAWAFIAQ